MQVDAKGQEYSNQDRTWLHNAPASKQPDKKAILRLDLRMNAHSIFLRAWE